MEIYVNDSSRDIVFNVPITELNGDATAKLVGVNSDGTDYVFNSITTEHLDDDTYKFTVTIPLKFVQYDRLLKLTLTQPYTEDTVDETYEHSYDVKVSTPILPLSVIASLLTVPGFDTQVTADDIKTIERATRYIIQSNTGQDFGCYNESRRVHGHINGLIELPGRLISITDINGATDIGPFHLTPSRLYLHSAKRDHNNPYWSPWDQDGDVSPTLTLGPSYNPKTDSWINSRYESSWTDVDINGVWGWNSVPEAVQEAAKLLVNDYACSESAYRDRYLGVMKSADWEINYREQAWAMTGNTRADQLLSDYVIRHGGGGVL